MIAGFRKIAPKIHKITTQGATALRRGDPYQNHTHQLRRSTKAVRIKDGSRMEMGMFYAVYVIARGYSNWNDVSETVKREVISGVREYVRRLIGG